MYVRKSSFTCFSIFGMYLKNLWTTDVTYSKHAKSHSEIIDTAL